MVYLHFPTNLTEEELMLQAKYQKLKKKKKAVVALKTARPEPAAAGTGAAGARDAREYARKLLKSGAIGALGPAGSKTPQAFKRPRAARDRRPGAHYTPFSAGSGASSGTAPPASPSSPGSTSGEPPEVKPTRPATSLYDSYVVARDKEERVEPLKTKGGGNTVFVSGHKISEEFLRKHLGTFGTIVNISMEIEKHRGFVTFDRHDVAQRAIAEMNGTMASGIQLEVSMARRQPQMERINEASSSSAWSTLAASQSQKGPHRDGRSIVSYEDLFSS